jgi:hypothetical protein
MARRVCAAVAAAQLLFSAWALAGEPAIRLPAGDPVAFQGVVSLDHAGSSSGAMLYPVPLAGLPVAVLAHGFLLESEKDRQKEKLRKAADKVLEPLAPVLSGFKHPELLERALLKMTQRIADGTFIQSAPVFLMTQDQSAIIVDNVVSIYSSSAPSKPKYQSTVRTVSRAQEAEDLLAFWSDNNGVRLKDESASLFAESLDIALAHASGGAGAATPHRTVRYMEGRSEKMERAQVLGQSCDRVVLRTLRDSLMSVPARQAAPDCQPPTPR